MNNELREHLRIGEAAKILEISVQTLRRWTKKGLVPHLMTPSGQFMYRREDLENFYGRKKTITQ